MRFLSNMVDEPIPAIQFRERVLGIRAAAIVRWLLFLPAGLVIGIGLFLLFGLGGANAARYFGDDVTAPAAFARRNYCRRGQCLRSDESRTRQQRLSSSVAFDRLGSSPGHQNRSHSISCSPRRKDFSTGDCSHRIQDARTLRGWRVIKSKPLNQPLRCSHRRRAMPKACQYVL